MPYVTEEDFEEEFGRTELDDLLAGGADFERVNAGAESLVNGYIGAKYPLPLTGTPDLVRAWTLDVTRYRLWDEHAPEEVRRRYEDAIAQLRDVAAGKMALPPDASGTSAATAVEFDAYSDERIFTASNLSGY
jgi:phage gp36-like protein